MLAEEYGKRIGQHSHMVPPSARKPAGVGEDEPRVPLSFGRDAPVEHCEVLHVLGHDRSAVGRRGPEQILIGQPDEIGTLFDGGGIVSQVPEENRDARGVHLVKEELHPDSSLRSFSQAANSLSAMSSLRAISASISSVCSA